MDESIPLLFPKYIEKRWKDRTLAYFLEQQLTLETGDIHIIDDFSTFVEKVFSLNLLTFTLSLPTFPYLQQVLALGDDVYCTQQGRPLGIRLKGRNHTTRWIISAQSWGAVSLSPAWLQELRDVYCLTNVGTQSTPGALGSAVFRQSFKDTYGLTWKAQRHRRPPQPYCDMITQESSGARSEVIQLGVQFDLAYEVDRHNGYGAALLEGQPTGRTYRVIGSSTAGYLFFFVQCRIIIKEPLLLGPFPVRVGTKTQRHPVFPTQPGQYETWLWGEEIAVCQAEGLEVTILGGLGWKESTHDFLPVVERLARLREEAPPELAGYFKLALVAFIGRLGMPGERYSLVSGDHRGPADVAACDAGIAYDWWIHQDTDSYPQSMPHIFSHTLMLCRLALFEKARLYAQQEQLIATNTDACIVSAYTPNLPEKGRPVETGEWTQRRLHHVVVKANRHLDSDEKTVHPGIPRVY